MTEAFIKAANAEAKLTANQGDSLERQIKQAESAKDYTKEIELQNKLLDNQNLQITQLQTANSKYTKRQNVLEKPLLMEKPAKVGSMLMVKLHLNICNC